jgi:hypothetical protein
MNRTLLGLAGCLVLALPSAAGAEEDAKKLDVQVLYAGVEDAPRTKEFKEFLGRTFTQVGTVDLTKLTHDAAKDYDVVIVDSPSPYGAAGKFEMPKTAALPADFGRPTIIMGAAGGSLLTRMNIKLNWL